MKTENNASGTSRENTQRIQTLDETASTLENQQEPEVLNTERCVTFQIHPDKRRGLSRQKRLDNAVSAIEALLADIDVRREQIEDSDIEEEVDERDALDSLRDELDNTLGEIQGVEFPGMYG